MELHLAITVGRFQITMNDFLPALFRVGAYTSSSAIAQCRGNVVEYVPKEHLGEDKTIHKVLEEALVRRLDINLGVPMLKIEIQGSGEVT